MSRNTTLLLGLVALVMLSWFCVRRDSARIEADIRDRTTSKLASIGYDWAGVEVDGRDVYLTGLAPSAEIGSAVSTAALDVRGVRVVNDAFDLTAETAPPAAAAPAAAPPAAPDVSACLQRFADLSARGVNFAWGEAELHSRARASLDEIVALAGECPTVTLQVTGHTDSTSGASFNMGLSQRRAQAVADYLRAAGLSGDRLEIAAFGEERPADSNETSSGRAENRRVTMTAIGG